MALHLRFTTETVSDEDYNGWDYVCGAAIRAALDGATSVVLTDVDGAQYRVWAEPVEDNS
jgi:hypothetical protein